MPIPWSLAFVTILSLAPTSNVSSKMSISAERPRKVPLWTRESVSCQSFGLSRSGNHSQSVRAVSKFKAAALGSCQGQLAPVGAVQNHVSRAQVAKSTQA